MIETEKALAGMAALGQALMSVATAGTPTSGPDIVDQQRLQFDGHMQQAQTEFAAYFAELLSTHPVTPEREQQEARARAEAQGADPLPAEHHQKTFFGIPIGG